MKGTTMNPSERRDSLRVYPWTGCVTFAGDRAAVVVQKDSIIHIADPKYRKFKLIDPSTFSSLNVALRAAVIVIVAVAAWVKLPDYLPSPWHVITSVIVSVAAWTLFYAVTPKSDAPLSIIDTARGDITVIPRSDYPDHVDGDSLSELAVTVMDDVAQGRVGTDRQTEDRPWDFGLVTP